jgi:hypothetical protein
MRRIIPLIVLTMHLLSTMLHAQAPCPAKVIEDCPDAGCGGWDKQLNIKKNKSAAPQQSPRPMTLEQIMQLEYPAQWYSGKERRELEEYGEGSVVQVTAYLVEVRDGAATSANCKLPDLRSLNSLLTLVSEEPLGKKKLKAVPSVIAEITPRVRLLHSKAEASKQTPDVTKLTTNWTKRKLDAWISRPGKHAPLVRITGLLLLDTEPTEQTKNLGVRYTDWEIHPVLEIEVCHTQKCAIEGGWKKLDEVTIKTPAPRKPVRSGPVIKPK